MNRIREAVNRAREAMASRSAGAVPDAREQYGKALEARTAVLVLVGVMRGGGGFGGDTLRDPRNRPVDRGGPQEGVPGRPPGEYGT